MDPALSQAYIFALRNAVVEIKKLEPCLQSIFLFQKDGQVIAKDDQTRDEQVRALTGFFGALQNRAENVDALTDFSLAGAESTLNICSVGDLYAGTVFSRETDPKTVKALTKIALPTIIKLVDQFAPANQSLPIHKKHLYKRKPYCKRQYMRRVFIFPRFQLTSLSWKR
jgi:hypothetical protein